MAVRFPYIFAGPFNDTVPYLDVDLENGSNCISVRGIVDSGAAVSLFPKSVGVALGLDWHSAPRLPRIVGNLGSFEHRGVLVTGYVPGFQPVKLLFGWSESDAVPILFGQQNFFEQFHIAFFRNRLQFELNIATP
jgi:hypothetical protein